MCTTTEVRGLGEKLVAPATEEEAEGAEVNIEDDIDEEVEPVKMAPDPGQPSEKQVEDHRRAHIPYRLWCKWCVFGRGRGFPHRRRGGSTIAIIGLDYFFITHGEVKVRNELEEFSHDEAGEKALSEARGRGEVIKCIAIRCAKSKAILAHVIPCKGADEERYVANLVAEAIEWMGHVKIILKADNEPALQSLIRQVLNVVRVECKSLEQAAKEEPATYDSQSNGSVELGIRLVRGMFRTLKCCLEARIGKTIPVNHALIPWLLEHTCLLMNTLVRGNDGLTSWHRLRGRPFSQQLLGIGEMVIYKFPSKGPGHNPEGNMGVQGREAIFLGYSRSSNTYIVGNSDGVIRTRSVTRRPLSERWRADALAALQATPWSIREKVQTKAQFNETAPAAGPTADTSAPAMPRRLRINQSDLTAHGYTEDCQQCRHMQRYGQARAGGQHSNACRERILKAIGSSEAGRARLAAHEERVDRAIAERIEHDDKHPAPQAPGAPAPTAFQPAPENELGRPRPPPASARVRTTEENEHEPEWRNVPGGERAPMTPPRVAPAEGPPSLAGAEPAESRARPGDTTEEATIHEDSYDDMEMEDTPAGDVDMGFVGSLSHDVSCGHLGSLEPSFDDEVSALMLAQMGCTSRGYRREGRTAIRRLVSEVYSPPRVTELLRKLKHKHLMPGFALDLTVDDPDDGKPWDFSVREKREKARAKLRAQKPYVLIGSPCCRRFSTWQALNRSKHGESTEDKRAMIEAKLHIAFVASLYREQLDGGRYFVHEHPYWATSWPLDEIQELLEIPGVQRVRGDQCQFGQEIRSGLNKGDPINKPTGFMTNSECIAKALARVCHGRDGSCSRPGGGTHRLCSGSHARRAAVYPPGLCRAIIKGIMEQLKADDLLIDGCYGVQVPNDDAEVLREMYGPAQGYSGRFKDDLTRQVLKDELVHAARAKELAYFTSKGVWRKVSKAVARAKTGKSPISVRWVDVNKGDELQPNYRSRLVARQLKALDHSGRSYFAPAPPLEALRTVVSMAMTKMGRHQPIWDPRSPHRAQISFVDVSRAYFNAKVDEREPPTFVNLPTEDGDHLDMCAQLLRHMYGTRGAADGWQEEYSTLLIRLGFRQGDACPNAFYHSERGIVTSVHGDDFTSSGPADALDWLEQSIGAEYEITIGPRLGPGPSDAKEGRALNRIIRWCDSHVEYEADPRQIERLIAECGLDGAKSVATPGVKPVFKELEEDSPLPQDLHTAFRGAAARGNYLAADRIDGMFACKEICRYMSKPTLHAWRALKRFCRYLNGAQRLVYTYPQQEVDHVDVYVDTDWAGCQRTRKSTSGGCVLIGQHTMKHWSSTQASVALSSGEAEFAGVIRGAGQGLGYQALLHDLGVDLPLRVWTDSSAAVGICSRQGLGKMRHLDTHTLWIQQAVRSGRVDLRKVDGDVNPADLLTKHSLSRERLEKLVTLFGCRFIGGRAASAPMMRRGDSTRTTMAQGAKALSAVGGDADDPGTSPAEADPVMPHVMFSDCELRSRYPSLEAPEDLSLEDFKNELRDTVLQKGIRIASEIQEKTAKSGRRRHEATAAAEVEKNSSEVGAVTDEPTEKSFKVETYAFDVDNPDGGPARLPRATFSFARTAMIPKHTGLGVRAGHGLAPKVPSGGHFRPVAGTPMASDSFGGKRTSATVRTDGPRPTDRRRSEKIRPPFPTSASSDLLFSIGPFIGPFP